MTATAEEQAAHWKGNHDHQVLLKQRLHTMFVALRDAAKDVLAHPVNTDAHREALYRLERVVASPTDLVDEA